MAHVITGICIGTKAAACVKDCPVDCIHPRPDEPKFAEVTHLHIDANTCIDCGMCAKACPVTAIFPEKDVPGDQHEYIAKNQAFYA
jgi:NAD-dependent dihydropyrimidine dehydrogenase PreA subunit